MAMGKHYGSFAKGFSDSLIAMMKLQMTRELYEARADYYRRRGYPKDKGALDAGTQGAIDDAKRNWGSGGGGSGAPRGVRNNNPGNIQDGEFAKSQPGYAGSDGRFAKFDTVANGSGALDNLLTKNYSGKTLTEIFNKYAPPGENDTKAYIKTVAGHLGISPDAVPDLSDPKVREGLKQSIVSVEQGIRYEDVPDYLAGKGSGGGATPPLIDASNTVNATGGADATQLHPAFANRVAQLSAEAEKATGQPLSFNELHRTTEYQAKIRAAHEAMPGGVEAHPAAKPGTSYHEFGAAGDMDDNKASRWAKTPDANGITPIQKIGLEQLGGQTGKNDPNHIQLPKSEWDKTAQADIPTKGPNKGKLPTTSYQVAGESGPVSEAGAEKAARTLAEHRAAPDAKSSDTDDAPRDDEQPHVPHYGPWHAGGSASGPIITGPEADRLDRANAPSLSGPPGPDQGAGQTQVNTLSSLSGSPPYDPRQPYLPVESGFPPPSESGPENAGSARAPQDYPRLPPTQGPPQRTGAPPNVGITPSAIPDRPVMGPPQRTGAPPNVGPTPSSMPDRPVMGPPQRTGAPPNVGPTPSSVPDPVVQMGPEGGGATTLPPEWSHMPSPGQVDPKGVYAPTAYAKDTGARPDLTARSPDANKPAPNATPVSTTRAIPATPAQDPRFTQITAPNSNPTDRNRPQMTALDLSHLWGPNPPVADRAPAPPGPPPPPPVAMHRPDDVPNLSDADFQGVTDAQVMGAAKGGPITRGVSLAKGGAIPSRPTMRFAAAGAVPYSTYQPPAGSPTPATVGPSMGGLSSVGAYANSQLGYQPWNGSQWLADQSSSPYGGSSALLNDTQRTADLNALTPAQQAWYTQQNANATAAGGRANWYYNPASYPTTPAAAAAAPAAAATPAATVDPTSTSIVAPQVDTTTIDPTTTTTTGIPGVANNVTANSYDPNVIGTTGGGSATDATGSTNYSVDDQDNTKQILSRKGGPIKRFAAGGAIPSRPVASLRSNSTQVTGFAAGGAAPGAQSVMNAIWGGTYNGPTATGGWMGTPYAQLAPNQQTWADQQSKLWGQTNEGTAALKAQGVDPNYPMSQLSLMPDAIWPTATTAAAPLDEPAPTATTTTTTPVDITATDPTSTTTTGIPGVPTTGTLAKTYDPNNIATTGTGSATDSTGNTNYSTDPKDQTTQILSRKGGPITRRVNRYDDGGGVSPSVAGAPPGATGGGAIPPIYYNPATYAAAGAPVGKGVSQTSAPTFGAGAIPSLPMARGGAVGYDDGGDVGGADDMATLDRMDFEDQRDDQANAAPAAPMTSADPNFYIMPGQTGAATAPTAGGAADHNAPPPDPTTPQIKDDQGNPSKGFIAALTDGLHWLGDHLGLSSSAQAGTLPPAIAHDPQTQDSRQKFVGNHPDGDTYFTHQNMEELKKYADPNGQLNDSYRNIAALEAGWRFATSRGDTATAGRLAASILHYDVLTSQNLSAQAAHALYSGDIKDAVDKTNAAIQAIPGAGIQVELQPDGQTVKVTGSNLNGEQLWQKYGSAATILEHATSLGRSGKLQWDALESQAAKYDGTFADMAKNRSKNANDDAIEARQNRTWQHQSDETEARETRVWQHQQDVADQKQKAKEDAATASQARIEKAFAPALPSSPVTPRVTPVSAPTSPETPAAPASSPDTTTASTAPAPPPTSGGTPPATPPPASDENQGQGPTVARAANLPSQPSQADIPTTDATAVEEYQRRYKLVADQVIKQVGAEPQPPAQPDWSQLQPSDYPAARAQMAAAQKDYQERYTAWENRVREGIAGEMKDIGADRSDQAITARDIATAKRQREEQERTQTFNEQAPKAPDYKSGSPMETTASLPRYAVYDSSGALDPVKSAQALGKAYDLPPPGGGAATGGLQRATTVANVSQDAATWNTHMGLNDVHDLVDGLARGAYTIEGRPTPVTRHGEQLDQFIVHQQVDPQGKPLDPGVTLFLPKQSGYNIVRIRQEFENAKIKPTTNLPPAPKVQSFPGVTPGSARQGGFNQPATPPSPQAKWWLDQALGRGQSPSPF